MLTLEATIVKMLKEAKSSNGQVFIKDILERLPETQADSVASLNFIEVSNGEVKALTNQIFSESNEWVSGFVLVTLPSASEDLVASFKWYVSAMH